MDVPGCATPLTRRSLLRLASNGFGYLALSAMAAAAYESLTPFPKAKNVIFLFMPGGVSHMESFDPKPKLAELDGKSAKLRKLRRGSEPQMASPALEVSAVRTMRCSCQRTLSAHGEVRR